MSKGNQILIKELADAEVVLTLAAQRCYKARKALEKVEGSSPATRKGWSALSQAQVVHITTNRRKRLLRSK